MVAGAPSPISAIKPQQKKGTQSSDITVRAPVTVKIVANHREYVMEIC